MAARCESWMERLASRLHDPAARVVLAAAGIMTLEVAAAILWRRRVASRRRPWWRWTARGMA
ncbi:MAG TPA: hypothetical protein VLA09_09325 [Longimicrobiales bacterium]|nr:hypothetical protein [Longimicrobiales bacterium]